MSEIEYMELVSEPHADKWIKLPDLQKARKDGWEVVTAMPGGVGGYEFVLLKRAKPAAAAKAPAKPAAAKPAASKTTAKPAAPRKGKAVSTAAR